MHTGNAQPSAEDVRRQLGRVLASDGFANAERMSRFLRYVVERTLAGEADRLKEYAIGVDVFDRREDYDPRVDSIVRVEAARLRTKVDEYYNQRGLDDPIVIRLRRGSYIPAFEGRLLASPAESVEGSQSPAPAATRHRWPVGIALVAAAFSVFAAVAWRNGSFSTHGGTAAIRVAVLPFAHYSNLDTDKLLAAQLTDGVTTELARLGTLAVVSHTSALQFADAKRPLREIAQALNAAFVVEGSVHTKGDRVHVSARLIDGASDRKVWVKDFEAPSSDLPALQQEMAAAVAAAVAKRGELAEHPK